MTSVTTDPTVRKTITVPRPVDAAFALFTERMGTWWPTDRYSIDGAGVEVVFEPRTGGRVYERGPDGRVHEWATVLAYDRPHRLVLEWKVGAERPPYTEVEVTFAATAAGTRVELQHSGWERLSQQRAERAADYEGGWGHVLCRYAETAAAPA